MCYLSQYGCKLKTIPKLTRLGQYVISIRQKLLHSVFNKVSPHSLAIKPVLLLSVWSHLLIRWEISHIFQGESSWAALCLIGGFFKKKLNLVPGPVDWCIKTQHAWLKLATWERGTSLLLLLLHPACYSSPFFHLCTNLDPLPWL